MVLAQTLPTLCCYCLSSLSIALVLSKLVPMTLALSKLAKSIKNVKGSTWTVKSLKGTKKVKVMKEHVDYTHMKKKDIPYGHYFKWIAFHNSKIKLAEQAKLNDKTKLALQIKKLIFQ